MDGPAVPVVLHRYDAPRVRSELIVGIVLFLLLGGTGAIFIWKASKFISEKNIIGLDLNKYNRTDNPMKTKLTAGLLYFLEYIIILPVIIFAGYLVFTFFLVILSQNPNISQILVISSVIIAVIRMTAYYRENLSEELAKLIPLSMLAVAIINPNTFSETQYIERIITNLGQIPNLTGNIIYYLLFIIILEMILRFFDFIFSLFGLEEEGEEKLK